MEKMDKKELFDEFKKIIDKIRKEGLSAADRTGEWFLDLVLKTLKSYFKNSNKEFFTSKYPGKNSEYIEKKLVKVAVQNSMIIGAVAATLISLAELSTLTIKTIPVAIPAALATIFAELLLLTKLQVKLIMEIAKLYDVELNPDDPEDILIIFAYALGGGIAEEASKIFQKAGVKVTQEAIKRVITRKLLKKFGAKIGVKLFRQTVARYLVPAVSIAIAVIWNRKSTLAIAKHASKYFKKIKEERSNDNQTV
jgi:uncharacterized protein (DUF697 family)